MNIDIDNFKVKLSEYADYISEIRVLSAVKIDDVANAEEYSDKLKADFERIGLLGRRCRCILKDDLYPVINSDEPLSMEMIDALQDFCEMLLDPPSGEELDLFLLYEISNRLLKDDSLKYDLNKYAVQLNTHISACYANINRTSRVTVTRDIADHYQRKGLKAAELALGMLYNKSVFLSLSPKGKDALLRAGRFYSALYDTFYHDAPSNKRRYDALCDAISMINDHFYTDNAPEYNWLLQLVRTTEHMGQLTERGNFWEFTEKECLEITKWLDVLKLKRSRNLDEVRAILPDSHYDLIMLRNPYFAGLIDKKTYQEKLLELYHKYSNNKYDMYSVQINLLIPTEYLATLQDEKISLEIQDNLIMIYDRIIEYALSSVNMDAFNYLQEYLIAFLSRFIELPDIMTFEDMGLHCIAALHPPTYVHSRQVASLGKVLASHLYELHPHIFSEDEEFSSMSREEIMTHMYHCGLCHDFGKLTMIDSIFIYGRDLLDREVDIIKMHSLMGELMLGHYHSTEKYAKAAKQHHIWYDGTGGYPLEEGVNERPCLSACILEIADCIDAATDTIGRSYSKGKTLEEVAAEIRKDSGTRYAPFADELLSSEDVLDDIRYLLTKGRQDNYKKAYLLLHNVKDRLMRD